ncbi:MAG: ribosome recycling factor [Prevotellaceae bacterium]|nr:ribosome recycling factor [Candidatus Colivivens caballi]
MSDKDFDILVKGLEKAEYNTLRLKSMRNEMIVHCDENGNITRIPARVIFAQLYNEPVPTY